MDGPTIRPLSPETWPAHAALTGALGLIAQNSGGVVEAGPEDTAGRKLADGFPWSGTLAMFEAEGSKVVRPLGKHHRLVRRFVSGSLHAYGAPTGRGFSPLL
jgi:hypothetical protein